MATKTNIWYKIEKQSMAVYARNVGFDLAVYNSYSDATKKELQSKMITEAMRTIEAACNLQGFKLKNVKKGIYLISLANPLSIQ